MCNEKIDLPSHQGENTTKMKVLCQCLHLFNFLLVKIVKLFSQVVEWSFHVLMVFLEKIKGKKKYVLRKRVSTMESRLEGIWDGIAQRGAMMCHRWNHKEKIHFLASSTWPEQNIKKISHQCNFFLLKKWHLKICSRILLYIIFCNWGFMIIPTIKISKYFLNIKLTTFSRQKQQQAKGNFRR